jgi:hypothetical protein
VVILTIPALARHLGYGIAIRSGGAPDGAACSGAKEAHEQLIEGSPG